MANHSRSPRLAVLIDADNASAKIVDFDEIAKMGEASVRRIYGDFASPRSKAWIDVLARRANIPQQQFAYTTGKNASDITLVIDAMDLLHSGRFDGFCLVSSDSDLARWRRVSASRVSMSSASESRRRRRVSARPVDALPTPRTCCRTRRPIRSRQEANPNPFSRRARPRRSSAAFSIRSRQKMVGHRCQRSASNWRTCPPTLIPAILASASSAISSAEPMPSRSNIRKGGACASATSRHQRSLSSGRDQLHH